MFKNFEKVEGLGGTERAILSASRYSCHLEQTMPGKKLEFWRKQNIAKTLAWGTEIPR